MFPVSIIISFNSCWNWGSEKFKDLSEVTELLEWVAGIWTQVLSMTVWCSWMKRCTTSEGYSTLKNQLPLWQNPKWVLPTTPKTTMEFALKKKKVCLCGENSSVFEKNKSAEKKKKRKEISVPFLAFFLHLFYSFFSLSLCAFFCLFLMQGRINSPKWRWQWWWWLGQAYGRLAYFFKGLLWASGSRMIQDWYLDLNFLYHRK